MPTDEEYLATAGITDESAAPSSAEPSAAPSAPPEGAPQSAEQKAIAMFELQGNKYPVNTEFAFPHGKDILKVPYEKLVNTYRQHQHLQDQRTKFSEEQKTWQQQKAEYDQAMEFKKKYGPLQDWSEKNPQDWQKLWELYQNKDKHLLAANAGITGQQPGEGQPNLQPFVDKISQLEEKLGKYEGAYNSFTEHQKTAQEQADTNFVKNEMSEFQKEYPEIDINERDPDNVVLWAKIMQWGLEHGYSNFKPAAEIYLRQRVHDAIRARERAEVSKGLKSDHMQGVVKRSATPISQSRDQAAPNKDVRKMSYGELAALSKQQLSSMGS